MTGALGTLFRLGRVGLPACFLLVSVTCARQETPPGGPEDRLPPIVMRTSPDTFQVVEPGLRELKITFSERISERPSAGQLDAAVIVSPDVGNVRVKHNRDGLDIQLQNGIEADRIYRVTVLPVISDMFGNRMRDPFDLVVSTGNGQFVPNVVAGVVEDRVTGDAVEGVRVEALFPQEGDTVVHWNLTDDQGIFSLRYVPGGRYQIRAFQDRNRDGEAGASDPQTRYQFAAMAEPPDTTVTVLSLVEPDTSRASLVRVEALDSLTLRFNFDDYLDPEVASSTIRASLNRSEGLVPSVVTIYHDFEYQVYRDQRADSLAQALQEQARLDALSAEEDTVPSEELPTSDRTRAPLPQEPFEPPTGLSGRILPAQVLYAILDSPMGHGVAYDAAISSVINLAGVPMGGGEALVVWERPQEESVDSLGADGELRDSVPPDPTQDTVGTRLPANDTLGLSVETRLLPSRRRP